MPSLEAQLDQVGTEDDTYGVVPAKSRQGWPVAVAHHIIVDCSMMSYVDSVGVNMLRSVRIYISNLYTVFSRYANVY